MVRGGVWAGVALGMFGVGATLAACSGDGGDELESLGPLTSETTVTTTTPAPIVVTLPPATTTTVPPTPQPNPDCIVVVARGDSLGAIAGRFEGVSLDGLRSENGLSSDSVIHPDDRLDVCIDNDIDDITGASRLAPPVDVVEAQQRHLNTLFAPFSIAQLAVDGDSGPLTRQMICAARVGLGLPAGIGHLAEYTPDYERIMSATEIGVPTGAPTWTNRWALIDKTCQVMFVGEGDNRLVDIYPTSTGEPGYETATLAGVDAFRYDPALDNGGWHDSSRFPTAADDPRNGNMYKPIYFNNGQAIHGANYVPPVPRSKGCARLFPWHHDRLIAWLGLDDVGEATWQPGRIGLAVASQGEYRSFD